MKTDEYYMSLALKEAEKGLKTTFPNPAVGCVIVKDDKILAKGYHHKAGEPHAEIEALKQLGFKADDCDIYVTLEPCSHYGKTPPCTDAIIKSGAKRVIISTTDPNPKVNGRGIKKLRENDIEVETDVLKNEGKEILKYFTHQIKTGLPFVTLKVALTLNGFINKNKGIRSILTGKKIYEYTLALRKKYDAVLIGGNTLFVDNPTIKGSTKIILTSKELPNDLNIFKYNDRIIKYSRKPLKDILKDLYNSGIGSILVEGGNEIFNQFIENGLYNEIILYFAPKIYSGIATSTPFYDGLNDINDLELKEIKKFDDDVMLKYVKKEE